jgi:hypothetical protein
MKKLKQSNQFDTGPFNPLKTEGITSLKVEHLWHGWGKGTPNSGMA